MLKKMIIGAVIALLCVIGLFFANQQGFNVGVELPGAPALFETSLAAPITSSATSFTLTANSVRGGGSLSGYHCFTIDEGSAQAEFACGTVSGTSVTSVTRGISPADGITSDSDVQFSHRRGASVKISDFPILQLLRAQNDGDATFENALQYAASVVPSSANDLADVGYVLSVVNGGTVNFDSLVVSGNAGETVATGTLVYFDATDQEWKKVDTDTSTTYVRVPVGITQGSGTNGNSIGGGGVLIAGRDTTQTGLTLGDDYYAGSSAGVLSTTESGLLIGRAGDSATELYVWPVLNPTFFNNTWTGTNIFSGNFSGAGTTSVFTVDGTWTKPTGAKIVEVIVIGAGGGGGGGAVDNTASNYGSGGAGGGGGGYSRMIFRASSLPSTVAVVAGTGGTGGTGKASGSAGSGANGTAGEASSFGSYLIANGGALGGGGDIDHGANSGGTGGVGTEFTGTVGGDTGAAATAGTAITSLAPTGGGGGGTGLDANGTAGGANTTLSIAGGVAGTGGGDGGAGNTLVASNGIGGTGGGGGAADSDGAGGHGGDGGLGAGGGGGGASGASGSTAFSAGDGGDGGNGIVIVFTY